MSIEEVVMVTTEADSAAVAAIRTHHAQLAARVAELTDALVAAVAENSDTAAARADAARFLRDELLPHARAEEATLYPAAARDDAARLLVESMLAEHHVIGDLVDRIENDPSPFAAAAAGYALRVMFDAHLANENDRILPVVAADPTVSLAAVTEGMHELLGDHDLRSAQPGGCSGHRCACGEA
ncbi:hemerythrin domain-containing protein [Rhodococcus sp. GXMU-t2271]|uniref:Hemerythrin domain-containing protein n=1 Tax=Rhodococcus indonesiensis TaxID=3055869 RepID=A0ABT7RRZ1_9NOCA|nr:hemerythrin domain-containing protein [Rhodococcus indonesiensis]MDM7490415.1 hemerythrin domain-containing protein [Rhodococcus indonesiensis]